MKITYILFCFLLGLVGCAAGNIAPPAVCKLPPHSDIAALPVVQRTLYLDPAFDPSEVAAIMSGALAWTEATRGIVQWKIRYGGGNEAFDYKGPPCADSLVMIKAESASKLVRKMDEIHGVEAGKEALAYTRTTCDLNVTIMIWDRIDDTDFFFVALHEIGHFLGMGHIEKLGAATMNPLLSNAAPCITKADLQAFCAKYDCDFTKLNACAYEPPKEKTSVAPAAPDASVGD